MLDLLKNIDMNEQLLANKKHSKSAFLKRVIVGIIISIFVIMPIFFLSKNATKEPVKRAEDMQKTSSEPLDFRPLSPNRQILMTAFLVQTDQDSVASFKQQAEKIDIVFPDWFSLTQGSCEIDEHIDREIKQTLVESGVRIMPRIANVSNGIWRTEATQKVIHDSVQRSCLAKKLSDLIERENVYGLNLDLEALMPGDREDFLIFVSELADHLHKNNRFLTIDVPPSNPAFDLKHLSEVVDGVILMAYDEHYQGGTAGPIASQNFYTQSLNSVLQEVPPGKLVVALGNYAYDWNLTNANTGSLEFNQVMKLANKTRQIPERDQQSGNMKFKYQDENNHEHEVWFLNVNTFTSQKEEAEKLNPVGFSLWRLGSEDPAIWDRPQSE